MARIAGVNIPQNKVVHVALTYIHGIGKKFSDNICAKLEISRKKRVNALTEDEVLKIREFLSYTMNICQCHMQNFILRNIYTSYTCHSFIGINNLTTLFI